MDSQDLERVQVTPENSVLQKCSTWNTKQAHTIFYNKAYNNSFYAVLYYVGIIFIFKFRV
jgi:hypothetical protein